MDLRQLAALVAVADHGSFSAAARALYTVQSNVSAHIAHLERELGVTLVDRAKGRLTSEGDVVVARARRVQRELEDLSADARSMGDEVSGEARVGVIGTTARWLVPQLLTAVHAAHPRVQVIILEANTTSLVPQLVAGRIDLAVVNLPVDDPEIEATVLFEEELVLLATRDSPLANRDEVSFAELARHPLVLPPHGTALRHDLEAEAHRTGVVLQPMAEIDGVRLMASLAFDGYCSTVVPTTAVPGWLKGEFSRVPIAGMAPRQVGLARRRRAMLSASARAVAEVLHTVIAAKGPRQKGVRIPAL
ncbi:MAG TPA: LysR family transcriptional regulator [Acidimicrobiales bacterium]|nr:LysR family transcriptional regulator [Acidimicrobiales bacterium]